MTRTILFLWWFTILSCSPSGKTNRQEELDFAYPSIDFSSFEQIKGKIEGSWSGKKSLLTKDTAEGKYVLEIEYDHEDFFTFTETKVDKGTPFNKTVSSAMLYQIEDYVFDTEGGEVLNLHYLSDKQLKLDDFLFEKASGR